MNVVSVAPVTFVSPSSTTRHSDSGEGSSVLRHAYGTSVMPTLSTLTQFTPSGAYSISTLFVAASPRDSHNRMSPYDSVPPSRNDAANSSPMLLSVFDACGVPP